jgi:dynein heavy chain
VQNYQKQLGQLADMVKLVRGKLDRLARLTLGALTVIDVHARDVTKRLIQANMTSVNDFEWISQMRCGSCLFLKGPCVPSEPPVDVCG